MNDPGMRANVYLKGYGFMDLYYPGVKGQIWEVKSGTVGELLARDQLDRYISANREYYIQGGDMIGTHTFYFMGMMGTYYNVQYWNQGNGIIRYTYKPITNPGAAVYVLYRIARGVYGNKNTTKSSNQKSGFGLPNLDWGVNPFTGEHSPFDWLYDFFR